MPGSDISSDFSIFKILQNAKYKFQYMYFIIFISLYDRNNTNNRYNC